MRGEVLQYDDNTGQGLISGNDGIRYSFERAGLRQLRPVKSGTKVDFVPKEGVATEIFLVGDASAELESSNEDLGLWSYFAKCMGKSFSGDGRARRKEYWAFALFESIFLIGALIAVGIAGAAMGVGENYDTSDPQAFFTGIVGIACIVLILIFLPASITVAIRRLHDLGLTGWWILLALVPYIGGIFMLIAALIPSERRTNKHGVYPKPLTA